MEMRPNPQPDISRQILEILEQSSPARGKQVSHHALPVTSLHLFYSACHGFL